MSSRVFQSVIVQIKEATDRAVGVIDREGSVVASTELSLIGSQIDGIYAVADAVGDRVAVSDGKTFKMLGSSSSHSEYVVFVDGTDEVARSLCMMACIAITEANVRYEEKYDKTALFKNILIDNILPGDIFVSAKELHLTAETPRAVFLVRQNGNQANVAAVEVLHRLFPDRQRDFIISISEKDMVVVKEISENTESKELYNVAASIEKAIQEEMGISTVIGIGTVAHHLRELADRYKEAQVAIDIVRIFESECTIINYENLGIGRLIYQLPTTLCEMFLSEIFKKNPIDSLDEETLSIIDKFFENNLNISETSRKLFVHRNTLVYRLGKIKKLTGLDLREFDQAIVFKVALMVKKYLDSQSRDRK